MRGNGPLDYGRALGTAELCDRPVSEHLLVEVTDAEMAVRDALEPTASGTRRYLIRRALLTGGTLALGGVTIAGIPRIARSAPSPAQDARILNLVLVLESLEEVFYNAALVGGGLTGELRQYANVVGDHERAHVAFIEKALGSAARERPTFEVGDTVEDPAKFTAAALALEDLSVAAYNGQAANLTKGALAAAARIVSVEARHAAWIRFIAGEVPAPRPVDEPATAAQVNRKLKQTGFVKSG